MLRAQRSSVKADLALDLVLDIQSLANRSLCKLQVALYRSVDCKSFYCKYDIVHLDSQALRGRKGIY